MKKTAVKWLVELLKNGKEFNENLINQAKEMEKEQRERDFIAGNDCACMEHEDIKDYFDKYIKSE